MRIVIAIVQIIAIIQQGSHQEYGANASGIPRGSAVGGWELACQLSPAILISAATSLRGAYADTPGSSSAREAAPSQPTSVVPALPPKFPAKSLNPSKKANGYVNRESVWKAIGTRTMAAKTAPASIQCDRNELADFFWLEVPTNATLFPPGLGTRLSAVK
jgi:hypothetical protein